MSKKKDKRKDECTCNPELSCLICEKTDNLFPAILGSERHLSILYLFSLYPITVTRKAIFEVVNSPASKSRLNAHITDALSDNLITSTLKQIDRCYFSCFKCRELKCFLGALVSLKTTLTVGIGAQ